MVASNTSVAKRFLVFAFNAYYPEGGWLDFLSSFDDLDEARSVCMERMSVKNYSDGHVVDMNSGTIVAAFNRFFPPGEGVKSMREVPLNEVTEASELATEGGS